MNLSMRVYQQQKNNADSLRRRIRVPIPHGYNLPPAVDLRPWMTDIEDQGEMGSCVANTIAGALEYLYRRYTGRSVDVSRLFIDFNARLANLNWSAQRHFVINRADPGDTFSTNRRAAMRAVQQYGFCKESIWPYQEELYMHPPPQEVYHEAARVSIVPLKVPINIVSVKTCLAHQIPVLVGILLSTNEADNNNGWVHIPETPPDEGYHACLVVGYDDYSQHFIIRNSWGTDWGDKGYCYVPYEYLIDKRLVATADAFWAIPEIVPRERARPGYFSYPNFTDYHLQYMLSIEKKTFLEHQRRRRHSHRRRLHFR